MSEPLFSVDLAKEHGLLSEGIHVGGLETGQNTSPGRAACQPAPPPSVPRKSTQNPMPVRR